MPAPDPRATVEAAQAAAVERLRAFGLPEAAAGKFAALAMAGALPVLTTAWREEMAATLEESLAVARAQIEPATRRAIEEGITRALAARLTADGTFTVRIQGPAFVVICDRCGGFVYYHDYSSVWLHRLNEEAARHTCPTNAEGTPA